MCLYPGNDPYKIIIEVVKSIIEKISGSKN